MRRQAAMGLGALLAFALGGCGTVNNLRPPPKKDKDNPNAAALGTKAVYGGVGLDARVGTELLASAFGAERRQAQESLFVAAVDGPCKAGVAAWLLAVDLPLSAVADTLTLPVTVPSALKNQGQAHRQARPRPDEDGDEGYDVDAPGGAPPQH
jgi:uncharacterized protein YceK